jgi:hypothetical protein
MQEDSVPSEDAPVNSALAFEEFRDSMQRCHQNWPPGQAVDPVKSHEDAGALTNWLTLIKKEEENGKQHLQFSARSE